MMHTEVNQPRDRAPLVPRPLRPRGVSSRCQPIMQALVVLTMVAAATLLGSPAQAQLGTTPAAIALELALENNIQARAFEQRCSAFGAVQRTLIDVNPINRQVLTAAIAFRAELHALSASAECELAERNLARYLDGSEAVFLVFVLNPYRIDPDAFVILPGASIRLEDEYERYEPLRHSPVLDANRSLGPGMTYGYVYFPNFRQRASESYAVQFDDGYVDLCATGRGAFTYFALGFDESELDFFDLLRRGIDPDALRRDHRIPTFGDHGLSSPDFLNLVSFAINLIGLIR